MRSANSRNIVVTLLLGIGLFALTFLFLPNDDELRTIPMRDNEPVKAFDSFLKEYSSGNRSASVIVPLSYLYLQQGNVDEAISLIEELSKAQPKNVDLLRTLGDYYRSAQRHDDYARLLEKVHALDPQEQDLRALGDIYNFQQRYDEQISVLQELIDRGWGNTRDLAATAYLHATKGEIEQALNVLDVIDQKNAAFFDHNVMPLRLSLLIDAGNIEKAVSLSQKWREVSHNAPELWELAGLFLSKGHPEAGLTLYDTGLLKDRTASLKSRIAYGALLIGVQRNQEAYDLLAAEVKRPNPVLDAINVYIQAAYGLGKVTEVLTLIKTIKADIKDDVLLNAIDAAYNAGLLQAAQELRDRMEPDSLELRPVLMGKLAFSLGEIDAAREWSHRAETASHLTPAMTWDLADLLIKLGREKAAKRHLSTLLDDPDLSGNLLFRTASLTVRLGEGKTNLAAFEQYRQQRPSELEANAAWALVASVAGKRVQVKEWLRTLQGHEDNRETLIDVYNIARDANEFELAYNTATVLHAADPSTDNFIRLLQAQLDVGLKDELQRTIKAERASFDKKSIKDAARLGEILLAAGQFDIILSSFQHFSNRLEENPALLAAWSRAEIQSGLAQNAFGRLQKLSEAGPLAPSVQVVFIESALALEQVDIAWRQARGHMSVLPVWLQAGLIDLLLSEKKTREAQAALAELGDDFAREHPLLPAELVLLQGQKRRALPYLRLASKTTDQSVAKSAKLANLWLRADERKNARDILSRIASSPTMPDASLLDVAHLFLKLDQIEQGEKYFTRMRQRQNTRLVSSAWALLAVGGQKRRDAQAWIRETRFSASDVALLNDLYFAASEADALQIAKDVAEKLWQIEPSQSHRLLWAQALFKAGDLRGALNAGKGLDLQDPQARQTYTTVLTAAVKEGLPGRDALVELLVKDLATARGKAQSRLIYDLFALQAHERTLPYLAALAETSVDWVELYWEALVETGREAAARNLLATKAMNRDIPDKMRREFAARLLASGSKEAAARVYRELAATRGPNSQDMQSLLYLWGPRPFKEDMAWLVDRAKSSPEQDRAAWLDLMTSLGAERDVVDLAKRWRASGEISADVLAATIRALDKSESMEELKDFLADAAQRERDPQVLREYTNIAWKRGLTDFAYRIGKQLIDMQEVDEQTLKILGYIAHQREDTAQAKYFLGRYLQRNVKGDFESHFYLAEALSRDGDTSEASEHYQTALQQIEAEENPSFSMEHSRGLILQRLGRYDEAIDVFKQLLDRNPNDRDLRADLAETLLLIRKPAQAYSAIDSGRKR